MCICERERERERERAAGEMAYGLFVHNKTQFCGKNMEMICCFYYIVYYFYLSGQVSLLVFGYFAVVRPLK